MDKMVFKIFRGDNRQGLEETIAGWLELTGFVDIKHVSQSEAMALNDKGELVEKITITVFYTLPSIKPK